MVGAAGCPLCTQDGGVLVVRTPQLRVIRAEEAGFPAFYRVVWNAHVAEFTDLVAADRLYCMEVVAAVESLLRQHLRPDKVNLAALGNMVPHLHWHVVGRWHWDSHFPAPIWATAQRPAPAKEMAGVQAGLATLDAALCERLQAYR